MKKQVIVLAFNGNNPEPRDKVEAEIVFPGLSLRSNIDQVEVC